VSGRRLVPAAHAAAVPATRGGGEIEATVEIRGAPRRAPAWTRARPGRLFEEPRLFVPATIAFIGSILALDRLCDRETQLLLGLATALVLVLACRPLTVERRLQVGAVVAVASMFEVLGSIVWGVYRYRLGNLPPFVPPGHGLVFLLGLRISELGPIARRPRAFVGTIVMIATVWALLGLTVLARLDLLGAIGIATFLVYLRLGPAPRVYAGVFVAVAMLELYGTAIGTWAWAAHVPGMELASGNPPSGCIAGYALFDIASMTFAGWATPRVRSRRLHRRRRAAQAEVRPGYACSAPTEAAVLSSSSQLQSLTRGRPSGSPSARSRSSMASQPS
jgi:hypothetical protein